jgi:hypothetical protein
LERQLMARLNIGGRQVTVDDSFLSLPPDQQNATVDEIAKSLGPEFSANAPGTGVLDEMQRTATDHGNTINQGLLNNPQKSAIGGLLDTGKGLLSAAAVIPDTLIGAPFRSVAGRGLTAASHEAGKVINPEVAAKDDPQQMYEDFRPGVDQALAGMAPRAASPVGARTLPAPKTTPAQAKQAAVDVWESPQTKSIQALPPDVANLAAQIENELLKGGARPSTGSAPGTFAELQRMTPPGFQPGGPGIGPVKSVSVDDLRATRRAFGETAKQTADFKSTPDARAASIAIDRIDDFLDTLSPALREANANYAAGSRAQSLDYRAMKAQHRADKTGSGSNIENTMRQEVDKIGNRGLSAEEIASRDRITEGSKTRNALRKVGKLGVSDGLSLLLHAGAAGTTGGASLPIAAAGTVARKIGEVLTRREIKALGEQMMSRSPLAQSLQPLPPKQASKLTKSLISALMAGSPARQQSMMGLVPARAKDDER